MKKDFICNDGQIWSRGSFLDRVHKGGSFSKIEKQINQRLEVQSFSGSLL